MEQPEYRREDGRNKEKEQGEEQVEYMNEDEEAGFAQQKQSRRRSRCGKQEEPLRNRCVRCAAAVKPKA